MGALPAKIEIIRRTGGQSSGSDQALGVGIALRLAIRCTLCLHYVIGVARRRPPLI